jgi:hypothetical protein
MMVAMSSTPQKKSCIIVGIAESALRQKKCAVRKTLDGYAKAA